MSTSLKLKIKKGIKRRDVFLSDDHKLFSVVNKSGQKTALQLIYSKEKRSPENFNNVTRF